MQYNASFAGSAGKSRLVVAEGFTKEAFNYGGTKINSSNLSYDNFIPWLRTGIGLSLSNTYYNYNAFLPHEKRTIYNGSLILSPKISIKGRYTLAPSASISFNSWHTSALLKINNKTDGTTWYYTTGILLNSAKYYAGAEVILYNHFTNQVYRITSGYTFRSNAESKFSISPQLVYDFHELKVYKDINTPDSYIYRAFHHAILNLNFRYKNLIAGPGIDLIVTRISDQKVYNQTSIFGMIGYQGKRFKLQYVQSIKSKGTTYSGQISFRYNFGSSKNSIALQN